MIKRVCQDVVSLWKIQATSFTCLLISISNMLEKRREESGRGGSRKAMRSQVSLQTAKITSISCRDTPGKMTCFKVAAAHQNRMNLRSPHQLLFVCYCRQPCPCKVAAGWRRPDRHTELARCRPLDTQSGAYITRWVNGSVRVGRDWCKRVCGQAAISCP